MPLDLTQLATNVADTTVTFGDSTVKVSYRPNVATPAAMKAITDGEDELEPFLDFLSRLLVSWDIVSEGAPVKTGAESLAAVPMPVLQRVMQGVLADSSTAGDAESSSESG